MRHPRFDHQDTNPSAHLQGELDDSGSALPLLETSGSSNESLDIRRSITSERRAILFFEGKDSDSWFDRESSAPNSLRRRGPIDEHDSQAQHLQSENATNMTLPKPRNGRTGTILVPARFDADIVLSLSVN